MIQYLPIGKKTHLLAFSLLLGITILILIHNLFIPVQHQVSLPSWTPFSASSKWHKAAGGDVDVRRRIIRLRDMCVGEDPIEKEYGRTNLRMTRAYEGSQHRMRRFLHKVLRGEDVTVAAIGGSSHHVNEDENWVSRLHEWMQSFAGDTKVIGINGATPATGSRYFSYCFSLHIPDTTDLIFVELAVNDEALPEHTENMEVLLRGLLELPHRPAVVLVEAMAFNSPMGGGGGRYHLPVAQYYDVPVINQRHPLVNHFARFPQLIRPYFTTDWWGNSDLRHFNAKGHRDLAMIVASFVRDVACEMIDEEFVVHDKRDIEDPVELYKALGLGVDPAGFEDSETEISEVSPWITSFQQAWPEMARSRLRTGDDDNVIGNIMPGAWNTPLELGFIPRMRFLNGWNSDPNFIVPPYHPLCLSTRSTDPKYNLTPIFSDGWEHWVHPEFQDKPYLLANSTGATVSFELQTNIGIIKMYSLRSRSFGFGIVECWVDDDRDKAVKADGYWDNDSNIGRFTAIRDDLQPGSHIVTCEVLEETSDPLGRHEFRLISVMSL